METNEINFLHEIYKRFLLNVNWDHTRSTTLAVSVWRALLRSQIDFANIKRATQVHLRSAISQDNEETAIGDAFPESLDESASQIVIDESGE